MSKQHYDVFISYRRDAYDSANLIATRLKAEGYRVFFDLETMRSGKFNEQLYSAIEECKDFVLVLSPDALDRCHDEEDWVRKEVLHAMQCKKNIVPMLLAGFQWPKKMPDDLEELPMYQGVAASKDFFDLAMQRLRGYLKSRRYSRWRRIVSWTAGVCLSLLAIYMVAEVIFRMMSVPVCTALTDHMTTQISFADILLDNNSIMRKTVMDYDKGRKAELSSTLDLIETELVRMESMNIREYMNVSGFQDFLLSLYGVGAYDLSKYEKYFESFFDDQRNVMRSIREYASEDLLLPSSRQIILADLDIYEHNVNALFFSYLSILNVLPEKSLDTYHSMAEHWVHLPKVGLGLRDKEYEKLVEREYNMAQKPIDVIRDEVMATEDSLAVVLAEMEASYQSQYEQYKQHLKENAIVSTDELGLNWGRIIMMASYLEIAVTIESEYVEGDPVHPVTSELVLKDLRGMLMNFADLYPDYASAVASAEAFYHEVAEGEIPLAGVLISIFAPGQTHPVYNLGDIIVSWNGVTVKDLSGLISANRMEDGNGKVRLLRLKNGNLRELEMPIPGNEDIVGFSNLINR